MGKRVRLAARLDESEKEFLVRRAEVEGLTMTAFLKKIIKHFSSREYDNLNNSLGLAESRILTLEAEVRVLNRLVDSL